MGRQLRALPPLTAGAVGVVDAIVGNGLGQGVNPSKVTLGFRVVTILGGLAADYGGWLPNNAGLAAACAGSALIAQRLPRAMVNKSISDLGTESGAYAGAGGENMGLFRPTSSRPPAPHFQQPAGNVAADIVAYPPFQRPANWPTQIQLPDVAQAWGQSPRGIGQSAVPDLLSRIQL